MNSLHVLIPVSAVLICLLLLGGVAAAAIPEAARQDPRFALGYLVVTHYPGVDPTGQTDSYAGLQEAIDDALDNDLVVFFPSGTYLVSDTLKAYEWRFNGTPFQSRRAHRIVGSALGERPLIKLMPDAPGFDDPAKPRPVLVFRFFRPESPQATSKVEIDDPLLGVPEHYSDGEAGLFDAVLRGIDFDLSGNPGAIGVAMRAAQFSSIVDVRVFAEGAYAGFHGIPGRDTGAYNIEVHGGRYGVVRQGGAGSIIVGARFYNQTEAAIEWNDFVPLTIVGFHIVADEPVVIQTMRGFYGVNGAMSLIDGIIEMNGGGLAIDNAAERHLYLRNVYVKGADELVKSGSEPAVRGSAAGTDRWQRIVEYAYTNQDDPGEYAPRARNFRTYSVIDGVVSRTPEPVITLEEKAPPADLVDRHLLAQVPMYEGEDDGTAVITDFGATPNDGTDDWEAIQRAIDSSKNGKVFVPKGFFNVSRPLMLRPDTQFLGVSPGVAVIRSHPNWQGDREDFLVVSPDDPDATTFIGYLELVNAPTGEAGVHIGELHWRSGRSSSIFALKYAREGYITPAQRILFKFSGNAGGKHYFLSYHQGQVEASSNPATRGVVISGTTEPLIFYGLNVEGSKGGFIESNIDIENSAHIRIYNMKREGNGATIVIRDSHDIGLFSMGRLNVELPQATGGYAQIYGDSNDIVMSILVVDNISTYNNTGLPMLKEEITDHDTVTIRWPDMVSVYKRGDLPDPDAGAQGSATP